MRGGGGGRGGGGLGVDRRGGGFLEEGGTRLGGGLAALAAEVNAASAMHASRYAFAIASLAMRGLCFAFLFFVLLYCCADLGVCRDALPAANAKIQSPCRRVFFRRHMSGVLLLHQ